MFSVLCPALGCFKPGPTLGGFKPALGGLSPVLGGLSLDRGGLKIGVPTFLGEVPPPGEKELGPVVFRLEFLAEGCFLEFWMDELRESLGFTGPTSDLVGLKMVVEGVFAETGLGLTCPIWLVLEVAEALS